MKLSTKARYGITAMMDLALHENVRTVTLADISNYQGISLSYLEQLFAKLRKSGLVRGVRGPGGGYRLARPATEISIAEIVAAINEGAGSEAKSVESADPNAVEERQLLEGMWDSLSGRIFDFLDNLSLDEFVKVQMGSKAETSEDMTASADEKSEPGSKGQIEAA